MRRIIARSLATIEPGSTPDIRSGSKAVLVAASAPSCAGASVGAGSKLTTIARASDGFGDSHCWRENAAFQLEKLSMGATRTAQATTIRDVFVARLKYCSGTTTAAMPAPTDQKTGGLHCIPVDAKGGGAPLRAATPMPTPSSTTSHIARKLTSTSVALRVTVAMANTGTSSTRMTRPV